MCMKKMLLSFQFLTIIPLRLKENISEEEIGKSSVFFPVVGAFQGTFLVLGAFFLGKIFFLELTNALLILLLIMSNGGFHLDGLADTFDAIAVRGDKEKKLRIMKDSTIGPIGVASIVFTILIKFLALNNLSHILLSTYYLSLFLMPILSKWTMVICMFHGKPAREDGLGRIFIHKIGVKEVTISTITLFLLLSVPKIFLSINTFSYYPFYLFLLTATYCQCRVLIEFFHKKFSGLTGDTIGAVSEITEITFLFFVLIWSKFFA